MNQSGSNVESCWVGNLDPLVTKRLLYELMIQAGPVESMHIPYDRVTMQHQGFAFVHFYKVEDALYACKILNGIKLFGKQIKIKFSDAKGKKLSFTKGKLDVGANIHVSNLDPSVDERALYDTFMGFGDMVKQPKIELDPLTGLSKGYGFVYFSSFVHSDLAIERMNGEWFAGRKIKVQYARKEGSNQVHGSESERLLAANQPE